MNPRESRMTILSVEPAVPMFAAVRLDSLSGQHFVDAFSVAVSEKEAVWRMQQYAKTYPGLQADSPVIWGPRGEVLALVAVHFLKWSE